MRLVRPFNIVQRRLHPATAPDEPHFFGTNPLMAIEKTLGKLAPLVLALALAGCGGDTSVSALPQPDETTTQQ
ncbi:hypothetical protein [Burkholderia ubonensis]|uniref:hypothetical protein n=1 Tax=Burkholderia ubonensis TaxID=101571 RepID=UPI000ADC447B|nr:hypothetical protein [Burkholderia ubonensis]